MAFLTIMDKMVHEYLFRNKVLRKYDYPYNTAPGTIKRVISIAKNQD